MSIHEIENLSHEELKAQKADLLEKLKAMSPDDLAPRYLQARTDAKQRDERMAEQAETLGALKTGLNSAKSQVATVNEDASKAVADMRADADQFKKCADATIDDLEAQLKQAAKERASEQAVHSKCQTDLATRCEDLAKRLTLETRRCERLKVQAERHNDAISAIGKLATDAMNSRELAQADEGE